MGKEVSIAVKTSLSKEQLQKEGIEIKITQNDIIDVLVQERVQWLEQEYKVLREEFDALMKESQEQVQEAVENKVRSMKLPKKCIITKIDSHYAYKGRNCNLEVRKLVTVGEPYKEHYSRNELTYRPHTSLFAEKCVAYGTVYLALTEDDVEFHAQVSVPEFTLKHNKAFMKRIEAHEKKVQAFFDSLPQSGVLNEKEIARHIKNTFTKEMLKNMSPEFVQTMRKGFSMNI